MNVFSQITASHYVLPQKVLSNMELSERFGEKKIARISKMSGIKNRRIADFATTAVDIGSEAAKRMIESLHIEKADFDMLIFASQTGDYRLPASAFIIHDRLGLPESCGAFDISMGCAAFPYALNVANGLIVSGQCKKILLVIAETVSKLIYPKDRGLVPLHGDGAACFVVEKSDSSGFEFADFGTESSGWKHLIVPNGGMRNPVSENSPKEKVEESGIITTDESLQMNGAAVFHFSITKVPEAMGKTLAKKGTSISEYDFVFLHQANKAMLDSIYEQLKVPVEKQFFFMEDIGNLSAASTPVLLAEALRRGMFKHGGRLLLSAFGVGLTWGIFSMRFSENSCRAAPANVDY